ncbi:MAG TPA: hypothetical protein VGY91_08785 [Chthoniobacterales bacterium]|nr:hypothetical protein [Chthoniobacterales bacterium]
MPKLRRNGIAYGAIAIVKHIEESEGRFYAEADIVLTEDMDKVKLELDELGPQLPHAEPLLDVRADTYTIGVSGNAPSPFQVDSTIPALCFPKGEER